MNQGSFNEGIMFDAKNNSHPSPQREQECSLREINETAIFSFWQ